ncbi:MAG: aminotransferase class III-fold pyridoxal phosphate-dependent enzyme [Phycisphaera sp.]|nr:aminotransferase class III-fold pyridoxal phosphate-dependent enzyme [Phycisphaera sp.]
MPDLAQRDLDVLWHPCSQMRDYRAFPPLHVVSAEGVRIRLADGRELIDAISSWWCKTLGHRHPRLIAALREQTGKFEHVILANTTNEPIVRLCQRLIEMANGSGTSHSPLTRHPAHFTKCFFADNGSTGVEVALKMALQAQTQRGRPRRTKFASLINGYHGETAGAMSVSDCDLYTSPFGPMMFGCTKLRGLPYRTGPDDPRWLDASDEWPTIEAQLDAVRDELAAIIYEPVLQGAGNMRLYSPDLLVRLRRWADAHGVYLIADEIAAGYGRLGTMLASQLALNSFQPHGGPAMIPGASPALCENFPRPDFVVLSKGLTGGFLPMSVVLTTQEVYDLFDADYLEGRAFLHSNTYAGHALGVALAHAVLDVFEQDDILSHVARIGPTLLEGLRSLAPSRPYLHNYRGCGMMAAVDLRQPDGSPLPRENRTGYRVYQVAVKRGALLRPLGDTMYLFPPLVTQPPDVDAMIAILADSLDAVM